MNKLLISAGALTALALTSAPAVAQVAASPQANAHARIFRPLTITSVRDLDLGTIVLSGVASYTEAVGITQASVFTCGAGSLTCSGTPVTAQYTVTGTNNRNVTVTVSPTIAMVNQSVASPNLTLAVDAPAVVNIGATGNAGYTFDIGGSIQVSDTTTEGVYLGTFDVSADYE